MRHQTNVVHLLLLPCHPFLQSAGYDHHPSSDQESEAKKKRKMKTSNLYKGSSNSKIISVTVKMLFSLEIRLSAALALHQYWIESISIKRFFQIHFPRRQSLSPKLRAGHNRPYPFFELKTLLKVMHRCHSITPSQALRSHSMPAISIQFWLIH